MNKPNYCGECALMMEEDANGRGYCAMQDLFTDVECGDAACEEYFISKKPMELNGN
jgi:hypothetical protein